MVPKKYSMSILLLASYYFYMSWEPKYMLLILLSTVITWGSAIGVDRFKSKKKLILMLCLLSNLSILFVFKYFNFFNITLSDTLKNFNITWGVPNFSLLLPVGISFYTFQALGYSIDVYRGTVKPEKNFFRYALFVSFFPQLVAGPIERTSHLLPQLYERIKPDYEEVVSGLQLMAWGLFKKVVIADRLAIFVNAIFNSPSEYEGIHFILGTVFFAFQIYLDFSGYSEIAIGASQILGIKLMKNFDRPYFAKSIAEFWRRWHISLSTWFKDYVYIPLGGNRVPLSRHALNLLITFVISGIWHGANWTFLIWGALHGTYLIIEMLSVGVRERIITMLSINTDSNLYKLFKIITTSFWVCIAWVFFRANSVNDAVYILNSVVIKNQGLFERVSSGVNISEVKRFILGGTGVSLNEFLLSVCLLFFLLFVEYVQRDNRVRLIIRSKKPLVRWAIYWTYILLFALIGVFGSQQFIYFQF